MTPPWILSEVDEARLARLAELIALKVQVGDLITLSGDLGAGKTTFARCFIRAVLDDPEAEVPSPTFTLVQPYASARIDVAHFDLYRLADPEELIEVGLDEALAQGVALVEWPERAGDSLEGHHLDIALQAGQRPETRTLSLTPDQSWLSRLARVYQLERFLASTPGRVRYMQGDASARAYARLSGGDAPRVLMDSPRQADGPPIRHGLPYSRLAHLAEDVTAFHALSAHLAACGLRVPEVHTADHEHGLLLIDDLGDLTFGRALAQGMDQRTLWTAALDNLIALRAHVPPERLPVPGSSAEHILPPFDRAALSIEIELLADWYWPAVKGEPMLPPARDDFLACWEGPFDFVESLPLGWILRDYHSPNLMWCGAGPVGVLDFQDAMRGPWAYDVVSLLQDGRLDVSAELEAHLLSHYLDGVARREPDFDAAVFEQAYAILGAQRATKLLGIFRRLADRDGKPAYLGHLPRIWRYLSRNLAHPALAELNAWFEKHFPRSLGESD